MKSFESLDEVLRAVIKIRDALQSAGEAEAAKAVSGTLNTYYTTTTEALGEVRRCLEETEPIWATALSRGYQELARHAMKETTKLMNLG